MLNSSNEMPKADPTVFNLCHFSTEGVTIPKYQALLEVRATQIFAVYLAAYYMYYLCMAGLLSAVAVFIFQS
jgi:hypothetical protein